MARNFSKNLGPSRGIKTNAYGNPIKGNGNGNSYSWIIYVILSLVILLVILYVLHISKIINIPLFGKRKDE